jgi:ribonuclease P protein component
MEQAISQHRPRGFVSLGSSRFGRVYRKGHRSESGGIRVISVEAEVGPPQVGIVAGRTVGNAVRRNRAKRRLREALGRVALRPDTAYVVVASPEVVAMPFGTLVGRLGEAIAGSEETQG